MSNYTANFTLTNAEQDPEWLNIIPKTLISFSILGIIIIISIALAKGLDVWSERREDDDSDMSEYTRNLLRTKIKLIFGARLFGFLLKGKKRKIGKDERKAIAIKLARQWRDYVRKVNKERREAAAAKGDAVELTTGKGDDKDKAMKKGATITPAVKANKPASTPAKKAANKPPASHVVQMENKPTKHPAKAVPARAKREKTQEGDFIAIELSPALNNNNQSAPDPSALKAQQKPLQQSTGGKSIINSAIEQTTVFVCPVAPDMSAAVAKGGQQQPGGIDEKDVLSVHSDFSSIVSFDNAATENHGGNSSRNTDGLFGVRLADKESFDKKTDKGGAEAGGKADGKNQTKYVRPLTASRSASRPITAGGRESTASGNRHGSFSIKR